MKFDLDAAVPLGKDSRAREGLGITARDRRFCREKAPARYWHGGDPVATAWHNALSLAFPRGEAFFIEAVKAFRDGASPKLEAEIRAFVKQEINHTREHVAFNRHVAAAGFDTASIDARNDARMAGNRGARSPIANLAATIALEHFTAVMAHVTLSDPAQMANAEGEPAQLWRWHSVEEIEHKGVAFDTYLHATKGWSAWRRWKLRSLVGLIATRNFLSSRFEDALDLLAQDGLSGPKWKWRLYAYVWGRPGMLRKMFPDWIQFFRPGFHPWKMDDRELIALHDSAYPDALLIS